MKTDNKHIWVGEGFYQVYFRGNYDRDTILKDMGKKWYIDELAYQPYPAAAISTAVLTGSVRLSGNTILRRRRFFPLRREQPSR